MASFIVDTSVVLALLNEEAGSEHLSLEDQWIISSVNACEIISYSIKVNNAAAMLDEVFNHLISEVTFFGLDQAMLAGSLLATTKKHGLSLADRACLALAMERELPVLTADRAWQKLSLPVEIQVIR